MERQSLISFPLCVLDEADTLQKLRESTSPNCLILTHPIVYSSCLLRKRFHPMCSRNIPCANQLFSNAVLRLSITKHFSLDTKSQKSQQQYKAMYLYEFHVNFSFAGSFLSVAWTQLLTYLYAFARNFHLFYNDSLQSYSHPSLPAMFYSFSSHSSNIASRWNASCCPRAAFNASSTKTYTSLQVSLSYYSICLYLNSQRLETLWSISNSPVPSTGAAPLQVLNICSVN